MFLHVSVCPQGEEYLGRYPLAGTPPRQVHPPDRYPPSWAGTPRQVHPPAQVHPLGRYTPPWQVCPLAGTPPGQVHPIPQCIWDTVNNRAVRIPLECILVLIFYSLLIKIILAHFLANLTKGLWRETVHNFILITGLQ